MKKKFLGIKYPKFLLFLVTIVLALFLLQGQELSFIEKSLDSLGPFAGFFAGFFFAYCFSTAPATACFFILAKRHNIFFLSITGGLGALVGDLVIFYFIKSTFSDEIELLAKEKAVVWINKKIPKAIRYYVLPVIGGFVIASPLPDEIGIAMLASSKLSPRVFSVLSLLLSTVGIFAIVMVGDVF